MTQRIAVLISTYNAPAMLRLVLQGYAQQSSQAFHLYIADDGSGDETRELIESFKSSATFPVTHLWHEDQGFRKARIHNIAIQQITEPYILLTDGDCIPLPNLVAAHLRLAEKGTMISGRRILLAENFTHALLQRGKFDTGIGALGWLVHRLTGHINRILPLLMPPLLSPPHQKLAGIRGCHLSCWRDDLIHINGFDESYEGWGREDSDLVARLFHAGVMRRDLRGAPVLHLWHRENDREQLARNDALLQACLDEQRIEALQGIRQLENDHP